MPKMTIYDLDNAIQEMQSSGDEYKSLSRKAQNAKRALVMTGSDSSGVWNIWAIVPSKAPSWLWEMTRMGNEEMPMDDWGMSFINDALTIMGSDVRFDLNGKPTSQLLFYRTQLQAYTDDEKLMKWCNSTAERGKLAAVEMQNGAGSIIAAAREAYYGERLFVFFKVFAAISDSKEDDIEPLEPRVFDDNVMRRPMGNAYVEDMDVD